MRKATNNQHFQEEFDHDHYYLNMNIITICEECVYKCIYNTKFLSQCQYYVWD